MNSSESSDVGMEYDESCTSFSIAHGSEMQNEDSILSADKIYENCSKNKDQNINPFEVSDKTKEIEDIFFSRDSIDINTNSPQKIKETGKYCDKSARAVEKRLHSSRSSKSPLNKEMTPMTTPSSVEMRGDFSKLNSKNKKVSWAGSPLSDFSHLKPSNPNIPPLAITSDHKIYVQLPLSDGKIPCPYPDTYHDVWDSRHVRMPNSNESLTLIKMTHGKSKLVKRWPMINEALQKDINTVNELQQAILFYNQRYQARWRFVGLKFLLEEEFTQQENNYFFKKLLPKIIDLALNLPKIVTRPPVLLNQKCTRSISLSQKQVACLLANAFLCTFPRRNARGSSTEYAKYPDINFNRLFFHKDSSAIGKIKCIINYFKEVLDREPDGMITFTRQYISPAEMPKFEECNKCLPKLHVDSEGFIEETPGLLQVDFANKYIGGGVLGLGCVQEEIRFVLCPELLVSMLFTEVLDKHEALIVTGVEQYNKSKGYASSFEWIGTFHDVTLRDNFKRRLCQVVGIDALYFSRNPSHQYKQDLIKREIEKAYAGFRVLPGSLGKSVGIATGNWGCGAFRGDPKLKSLIQIVAAGVAGRDLAYFTFGDEKLRDSLVAMHQFLTENSVTIGELVMILCQYGMARKNVCGKDLYMYIQHNIKGYNSDTDSGSGEMEESCASRHDSEAKVTGKSKGKLEEKMEETLIEKTKVQSPHQSTQKNVTIPHKSKCITDYFKAAPGVVDMPSSLDNTATMDKKVEVTATKHWPNLIPPEKLSQVLNDCDKVTNKSMDVNIEAPTLISKYFEYRTNESCESKTLSDVTVEDDVGNSEGLFAILNKYDKKLD